MTQGNGFTRRDLLGAAAAAAGLEGIQAATRFSRVYLPPGSALPVQTAATELAAKTGASIVNAGHRGEVQRGEIVLVSGRGVDAYPETARMLRDLSPGKEWEFAKPQNGGLLIAGSTPRNVCCAALGWIANPEMSTEKLSVYQFAERFTMWDNPLNQMYRFSKGFDRRQHIREIARMGHTGVEVNRYSDPGGYFVKNRKFAHDSYTWYLSYAPALDAFVESSLTKGLYPAEELAGNLADLKEAAGIARSYGLKPGFVCYEPRCVPEAIFDRFPELRGSRVDHPGRSLEPRYALDIANPRVLDHYVELMTNLMAAVPDLRYLVFFTQDSGSGLPFARRLYFGPNGSWLARSKTVERMAADFTETLLGAGRKINPEFEVIMQITWEYPEDERKKILAALPKGVTVNHEVGGEIFTPGGLGGRVRWLQEDREAGLKPYAGIIVTTRWEQAPIIGVPAPVTLAGKMTELRSLDVGGIFTGGGTLAAPHCPYHINQEVYAAMIRGEMPNLDGFLLETATRWCEGDGQAAKSLVAAWKTGEEAICSLRILNWYHAGSGQTQGRWLTRPLAPDLTRLSARERAPYERKLFPLPWDIARLNIAFEGGIRQYDDERLDASVRNYDSEVLPGLEKTVRLLDDALAAHPLRVLEDQRDRYRGLLLNCRTVRNLFDAQVAINNYLLKRGNAAAERQRLRAAIQAEIANTREWIRALRESRTYFFRVADEETTFVFKTPAEDFAVKLEAMQAHIDDEPGPYLKELPLPFSARRLLYMD